jgi:hypothetical protein
MIQLQLSSYLKAAWNMRKAYKSFESLSKHLEDKDVEEEIKSSIKYGLGLFYWVVGLIPSGNLTH